jgi:ribosomal protein S18 acetylase RimI-like enzyme
MESQWETGAPADHVRITLRAVTPADDEFLLKVYGSTRADELAQVTWWDNAQKESFLRFQLDMQRRTYFERFPDAQYSIILYDGAPVGRIWIGRNAEEIRLLDIAILPAGRNNGIGATLLRQLKDEARQMGRALRHMVDKTNDGALRFYTRLDFRITEDAGTHVRMEWRPEAIEPAPTQPLTTSD